MNERIKELAKQAGITICQMVVDGIEYDYQHVVINDYNSKDEAAVLEKFAELIVKECAKIVNSMEQYEGQGDCHTAEYIKEHFGVEE